MDLPTDVVSRPRYELDTAWSPLPRLPRAIVALGPARQFYPVAMSFTLIKKKAAVQDPLLHVDCRVAAYRPAVLRQQCHTATPTNFQETALMALPSRVTVALYPLYNTGHACPGGRMMAMRARNRDAVVLIINDGPVREGGGFHGARGVFDIYQHQ